MLKLPMRKDERRRLKQRGIKRKLLSAQGAGLSSFVRLRWDLSAGGGVNRYQTIKPFVTSQMKIIQVIDAVGYGCRWITGLEF